MIIKEILTLIKNNEIFEHLFMYEDDATDENIDNFFDYEETDIKKCKESGCILYTSFFMYGCLVCLNKNNSVFTVDNELEINNFCNNFYEIPFCFWYEQFDLENKSYSDVGIEIKRLDIKTYNYLIFYKKWLEENNIKIDEKYFDLIK